MPRGLWWALAGLLLATVAGATREPTVPPVYYLLDYGSDHLDNPGYPGKLKALPPDLLHFGKDVPMTHLFGPIQAVGGENQAHGRHRADIRRLSPAEVKDRLARLQKLNADLHAAGVKAIMPYTSALTYAGDPVKREGLFEFYDHWNEYAEFGIGPKPAADPAQWLSLQADGSPNTFGPVLAPPYFTGMNRYVACLEHPDWRHWLQQTTRLIAVAGYDGAFPDNSSAYRCYAPSCQAAFGRYLATRFRKPILEELFGTRDASLIKLPTERPGLLWIEAHRFWQTSLANHLAEVRQVARQANPRFQLFPNGGSPLQSAEYLAGKVDYLMLEGGSSPKEGAGVIRRPIIGRLARREVIDNLLEYRYVADVPGDLRLLLLELGRTPSAQQLCLAEAAAFGSGAYNGARLNTLEAQKPMIQFLRDHRDLYEGKTSAAGVALLYFPMRLYYPNTSHLTAALRAKDRLAELQIPFDCFAEGALELKTLKTYKVCLVPEMTYLSPNHLEILKAYVSGGGRLLVLGECATHDDLLRSLPAVDWLPPLDDERKLGEGTVLRTRYVPTRAQMMQYLTPAGPLRLVEDQAAETTWPLLRTMIYEGATDRVVHLVNYGCPVTAEDGTPTPLREVKARIPLPLGAKVKGVTLYRPGQEPAALEYRAHLGTCLFTVPQVDVYAVCRLTYDPPAAKPRGGPTNQ